MSEALARICNDSVLSRPAKAGAGILRRLWDRASGLPARAYVSAALSALLVGIGVNALLLQRERHPAPLFVPSARPSLTARPLPPVTAAAPAPVQAEPIRERSAPASAPFSPPPARSTATSQLHTPDQIGDLLRAEPHADESRLVFAAQTALAKLGYPIKVDGAEGAATEQALHEFERAHGLPLTTEITAHLVRQLSSAAHANGR